MGCRRPSCGFATLEHPVKLNNEWIKPRDKFKSETKTLDLMNLILDRYHEITISNGTNELTIATLNKFEWKEE